MKQDMHVLDLIINAPIRLADSNTKKEDSCGSLDHFDLFHQDFFNNRYRQDIFKASDKLK
jgi:hypothetical protein